MGFDQNKLYRSLKYLFEDSPATRDRAATDMAEAIVDAYTADTPASDDTDWAALPLTNGWVNKGSAYGLPQYRRLNGRVYLRGCINGSNSTSATFVASMPEGFCTPHYQTWSCYAASTSSRPVTIGSSGQMYTDSNYATLYLDGISYEPAPLDGSWTALTLTSSWRATAGIYEPPAYKRVGKMLYLKGHVTRVDTNNTTITTLPVGCRPPAQRAFANHGASTALTALIVTASGTVSISTSRTWVYLDNVFFEVAQ